MYVQIGDIRGIIGIAILALTQRFAWMFEEPDEYLNYQLGNTSLCWHNGRLLALMEGGMPFQAHVGDDGSLASVGPYDFDGGMTAATSGHPKVCPVTGEMHSFFYRCDPAPVRRLLALRVEMSLRVVTAPLLETR